MEVARSFDIQPPPSTTETLDMPPPLCSNTAPTPLERSPAPPTSKPVRLSHHSHPSPSPLDGPQLWKGVFLCGTELEQMGQVYDIRWDFSHLDEACERGSLSGALLFKRSLCPLSADFSQATFTWPAREMPQQHVHFVLGGDPHSGRHHTRS